MGRGGGVAGKAMTAGLGCTGVRKELQVHGLQFCSSETRTAGLLRKDLHFEGTLQTQHPTALTRIPKPGIPKPRNPAPRFWTGSLPVQGDCKCLRMSEGCHCNSTPCM